MEHYSNLQDQYVYYTECAIATYEYFALTKSAPSYERERTFDIAENMVKDGKRLGVDMKDCESRLNSFKEAMESRNAR